MTITRDGNAIELTEEELYQAYNTVRLEHLRMDIDNDIDNWATFNKINFDFFETHGHSSADEFRSAFIDECVPLVDERVDNGWSYSAAIEQIILELAKDYDIWNDAWD